MQYEEVLVRAEIREVLIAYAQAQDQNEWPLMARVFTADAVIDLPGTELGRMQAADFVSFLRDKFNPTRLSGQHALSNILFTIHGDQAKTLSEVSYFTLQFTDREGVLKRVRGNSLYADTLIRQNNVWRVQHRIIAQKNIEIDEVSYSPELIAAIRLASQTHWFASSEK